VLLESVSKTVDVTLDVIGAGGPPFADTLLITPAKTPIIVTNHPDRVLIVTVTVPSSVVRGCRKPAFIKGNAVTVAFCTASNDDAL